MPSVIPMVTPHPRDLEMADEHRAQTERVLRRLHFLPKRKAVPNPYRISTGVAGKSKLYFFAIPSGEGVANLVVKFDEPIRASQEWKAIRELRRTNVPPLAMLPLEGNREDDGLVIYRDAGAVGFGTETVELRTLLERQIHGSPDNCVAALRSLWNTLDIFYRADPGSARLAANGEVLSWRSVFPGLGEHRSVIESVLDAHHAQVPLQGLPDPPGALDHRLNKLTGKLWLSRIHGDLNLQNVLIGLDGTKTPVGSMVIDLANTGTNRPTALDFARLETEVWHECFAAHVGNESDLLGTFKLVRDCLDGRHRPLGRGTCSEVGLRYLQVVCAIRSHAAEMLRAGEKEYLLEDYQTALYLQHLLALHYKSVNESQSKTRLSILGAALSLKFLDDLDKGNYSRGALSPLCSPVAPCEEMIGKTNKLVELLKLLLGTIPKDFQPGFQEMLADAENAKHIDLVTIVSACLSVVEDQEFFHTPEGQAFAEAAGNLITFGLREMVGPVRNRIPSAGGAGAGEIIPVPFKTRELVALLLAGNPDLRRLKRDGSLAGPNDPGMHVDPGFFEAGPATSARVQQLEELMYHKLIPDGGPYVLGAKGLGCDKEPCVPRECQDPCKRVDLYRRVRAGAEMGRPFFVVVNTKSRESYREFAARMKEVFFVEMGVGTTEVGFREGEFVDLMNQFLSKTTTGRAEPRGVRNDG